MTIAVELPFHVYGYVDKKFLSGGLAQGLEPAVWFGVTVPKNRAIGLTVLLECGAQYRQLPSHAWAFNDRAAQWTLKESQSWDCFGEDAQVLEYKYLRELPVRVIPARIEGHYLFTLEFDNDGFSRNPAQSKSMHALELKNGRLTWQPNNAVIWSESSFTVKDAPVSWIRRQSEVWGVEE